jgi:hypothetical protein
MHPVDERGFVIAGRVIEAWNNPVSALEHFAGGFCKTGFVAIDKGQRLVAQAE